MHRRPIAIYEALLADGDYKPDAAQRKVIEALDRTWLALTAHPVSRRWAKVRGRRRKPVQGLYLWGGVGRGKTWLMDVFFESLPGKDKQRIHFHRFMARVHAALKSLPDTRNPLRQIARDWAAQYRVLCFDEFFVADIADAMLLGGLLQALFAEGVTLVATSNVAPDDLYRDGLQRAKFLPAIESLKEHCLSLHVDGERDFRLRLLQRSEIFHHPLDDTAETGLAKAFADMSAGISMGNSLEVNGRTLSARQRGDGIIWFNFSELCDTPTSTADYIEIARAFNTVLLSDVPRMDEGNADATRRFINLIDEFYDRNVKMLISAAGPIDGLYDGKRLEFEFQRTASRLTEMQSNDYLAKPHLP
ncbi:MAG: AFG1 family ATPase [Gammaproteobacteria bacterium]|nr:AFG1 family ATPase [Gammaproteobacteria bacterium]NNK98581.1 cell division protein ZapE [Xanthomonadales bacterium]